MVQGSENGWATLVDSNTTACGRGIRKPQKQAFTEENGGDASKQRCETGWANARKALPSLSRL